MQHLNVEENFLTEFINVKTLEADGNFIPGFKMRQLDVSEFIKFKYLNFDVEFWVL